MPPGPDLREVYRLEKENNQMLHAMQRRARWGIFFRIVLFLLALSVPIWLYITYLSPVVKQLEDTVNKATGTKIQIDDQFAEWMRAWEEFKSRFGGATSTKPQ